MDLLLQQFKKVWYLFVDRREANPVGILPIHIFGFAALVIVLFAVWQWRYAPLAAGGICLFIGLRLWLAERRFQRRRIAVKEEEGPVKRIDL